MALPCGFSFRSGGLVLPRLLGIVVFSHVLVVIIDLLGDNFHSGAILPLQRGVDLASGDEIYDCEGDYFGLILVDFLAVNDNLQELFTLLDIFFGLAEDLAQ